MKRMCIEHLARASILSITMDQFTCTVLLDVKTCFRAWGYHMLSKEMHCKKEKAPVCNATDSIDDESYEMHCKKKARICKATEECMDDESDERHCKKKGGVCSATDSKDDDGSDEENGYPLGWGWLRLHEEDASFADNVSPLPPHVCHH